MFSSFDRELYEETSLIVDKSDLKPVGIFHYEFENPAIIGELLDPITIRTTWTFRAFQIMWWKCTSSQLPSLKDVQWRPRKYALHSCPLMPCPLMPCGQTTASGCPSFWLWPRTVGHRQTFSAASSSTRTKILFHTTPFQDVMARQFHDWWDLNCLFSAMNFHLTHIDFYSSWACSEQEYPMIKIILKEIHWDCSWSSRPNLTLFIDHNGLEGKKDN